MPESALLSPDIQKRNQFLLFGLSFVFIISNSIFLFLGYYIYSLLPIALFLVFLAFVSLKKILFVIVFFVPLSVQLKEFFPDLGLNLYLPSEPLLVLVLFLFLARLFMEKNFPKNIFLHPVSLAIFFYLMWLIITTLTSSMPLVSFKFVLTRIWFIVGFYFLPLIVFSNQKNFTRYISLYGIAMVIVVSYTLVNHIQDGLINQKAAHGAPDPFFNDHTSYGAILAMLIPVFIGLASRLTTKTTIRILLWLTVVLFLVALTFSYSRAAWISVIAALGVFLLIKFRIKFSLVAMLGVLAVLSVSFYWGDIMMKLEQNRQDSANNFSKHIESMSNISSDASNLERINRWASAIRMFKERPFLGWGPGTYMFQYAGFQSSREKTIISTNFGDRGNSHSEYIGPLSESGILGSLSIVLVLSLTFYTGFRYYNKNRETPTSWMVLAASLGLLTYAVHGFLNNFLDTDKASALFWGYMALIVSFDLYKKESGSKEEENRSVKA